MEKEISVIIYFTKLALSCSWSAASQNQDDLLEIKITTLQVLFCFQQGKKVKQIMRFNWNNWFYLNNYFSHIYYGESTHLNYSFHLHPSLLPSREKMLQLGAADLNPTSLPSSTVKSFLEFSFPPEIGIGCQCSSSSMFLPYVLTHRSDLEVKTSLWRKEGL